MTRHHRFKMEIGKAPGDHAGAKLPPKDPLKQQIEEHVSKTC